VPRLANVRSRLVPSLGLLALTLVAYAGVLRCGFVGFDDDLLVYRNPHLSGGLSWAGVRFAFGADLLFDSPNADYWTPLTVLSRLVDVELFGLDAAGHHATNVLLHAGVVVLLFNLLASLTGAVGRSAFVAALMAVHPLHVESVAWVTERKDVLSGVFFVLTLSAYARYARSPTPARLALVAVALALGLLCKPMLITTPFVLVLLDLWPLGRLAPGPAARAALPRLLAEKWPLFLLSAASVAATFVPLRAGGRLTDLDALPYGARIGNALLAYWVYVRQTFWPHPLAVPYPHPGRVPLPGAIAAAVGLAAVTPVAVRGVRARPWLLVGWLWFLGMLVPVSGLVQSGEHSHADRYMYLPSIGLSVVIAWGVAEGLEALRAPRLAPVLALVAVAACVPLTRRQVRYWESTVSLFSHSVAVTTGNAVAHRNLAAGLALQGDLDGGEREYREALKIQSDSTAARAGLGVLLLRRGRLQEALSEQQLALAEKPSAEAYFNLGAVEARLGHGAEAEAHYA
jgi:protein O-mannosyl-transferase